MAAIAELTEYRPSTNPLHEYQTKYGIDIVPATRTFLGELELLGAGVEHSNSLIEIQEGDGQVVLVDLTHTCPTRTGIEGLYVPEVYLNLLPKYRGFRVIGIPPSPFWVGDVTSAERPAHLKELVEKFPSFMTGGDDFLAGEEEGSNPDYQSSDPEARVRRDHVNIIQSAESTSRIGVCRGMHGKLHNITGIVPYLIGQHDSGDRSNLWIKHAVQRVLPTEINEQLPAPFPEERIVRGAHGRGILYWHYLINPDIFHTKGFFVAEISALPDIPSQLQAIESLVHIDPSSDTFDEIYCQYHPERSSDDVRDQISANVDFIL